MEETEIDRRRVMAGALAGVSTAVAQPTWAEAVPDARRRPFTLANFRLESGVVLPHATVMCATWGKLNAAGDNAVLLPSHYMADATGYDWLIGADKALNPTAHFLVATELFGNGTSSSPATRLSRNTAPAFPSPPFATTSKRAVAS